MPRALLDVNVLIALLDPDHVFHARAHQWWKGHAKQGWASCPLTENGTVRVMSNAAYSSAGQWTPSELIRPLDEFSKNSDHEFWPDDVSLRDKTLFLRQYLHSSRSITDFYLLALATKHRGTLATFDQNIAISAVHGATDTNLTII